jgi:anti-repressor protein
MNELTKFNFSGKSVRVVMVNNEPWWFASDVCSVLGIVNGRDAIKSMPDDEKSTVDSTDGGPARNIVSEGGLYRLVFQSRKPEAELFRKWVTSEVLPQIRKTGTYGVQLPTDPVEQVLLLASKLTETAKIVLEERSKNQALTHHIQEMQPKIQLAEKCLTAKNLLSMNEVAKEVGTGRKRLFEFLRQKKILMSNNQPYQEYIDRGYFQVKIKTLTMGDRTENYSQTYVTAKGLEYISNIIPDQVITQ